MELREKVEGILDKYFADYIGYGEWCETQEPNKVDCSKIILSLINQECLKGRIDELKSFTFYGDNHKNVKALDKRIEQLQEQLKESSNAK